MRQWITRKQVFGQYETLDSDFTNFMRMEPAIFHEIFLKLTLRHTKDDTKYCKALEPGLKLAVALCFLADDNSYHSLSTHSVFPTTAYRCS